MNNFFCQIPNRGRVRVSGPDAETFLQGLITADVTMATAEHAVYGCLLTAQGRFLHDFFVTRNGNEFWLDCEGGARTTDLETRLKRYKLRSAVALESEPETTIFAGTGPTPAGNVADPRHPDMGWRGPNAPENQTTQPLADFTTWDAHRIRLGVPDGSRDLVVEESLLMENNMHKLHGVSFTKGCFVGQEITARMHHRNLGKKVLVALSFPNTTPLPAPGEALVNDAGQSIGEMRSACTTAHETIGLALVKRDALDDLAERLITNP